MPVMGVLYILVALFVLIRNAGSIPSMFASIFSDAFTLRAGLSGFRAAAAAIVFIGAVVSADLAWNAADLCQALMVVTNIPSIIILSPIAVKALANYTAQLKQGRCSVYVARENGVTQRTDYWN